MRKLGRFLFAFALIFIFANNINAANISYSENGYQYDVYNNADGTIQVIKEVDSNLNVIREIYYDEGSIYDDSGDFRNHEKTYRHFLYIDNTNGLSGIKVRDVKKNRLVYEYTVEEGSTYENMKMLQKSSIYYTDSTDIILDRIQITDVLSNRVTEVHYFSSGTKYYWYGTHYDNFTFKYQYQYNDDGTILGSKKREMSTNRIVSEHTYKNGTLFSSIDTNVIYRDDIFYNSDETIKNIKRITYDDSRTQYEFYFTSGTKYYWYGTHLNNLDYNYKFSYNTDGSIKRATRYGYNAERTTAEYYYSSGTRYGSHADRIVYSYKFFYNSNGTLNYAYKYDYALGKNVIKYIYLANTYYGSHANRISERIDLLDKWTKPTNGGFATTYSGHAGNGIDIGSSTVSNYDIKAAKGGTVETVVSGYVGSNAAWGYANQIVINHGGGIKTRYAHLETVKVKKGDKVSAGQVIARMGYTGYVIPQGPGGRHLHFEVHKNGVAQNPLNYVNYNLKASSNFRAEDTNETDFGMEEYLTEENIYLGAW